MRKIFKNMPLEERFTIIYLAIVYIISVIASFLIVYLGGYFI